LGSTGVITFETAVALVLGENIGTTITAFLASIGASKAAKRTAYAHIFIKIFGVSFMLPVFYQYIRILNYILPLSLPIDARIAFSHTFFNIITVCIFLALLKPLIKFIYLLLPERQEHQEVPHLTFLDIGFHDTPALAIQQSFEEILRMSKASQEMMSDLRNILANIKGTKKLRKRIFQTEKDFDIILKEIITFIRKLITGNIPQEVATEARIHLRMADEYESISDNIAAILKLNIKFKKDKLKFTKAGKRELLDLHDTIATFIIFIEQLVINKNTEILKPAIRETKRINEKIREFRNNHLNRLTLREMKPEISQIYMDFLNLYRLINEHALNIAEALAGRK
jgi:phosphate:Na+ symporter